MEVLTLIKHAEGGRREQVPQGLMDATGTFIEQKSTSGVLKDTGGLTGTAESLRVRQSGGKLTVLDGPFTEAKEIIGGYAMSVPGSRPTCSVAAVGWPVGRPVPR